jgi:hypothetical protein
MKTTMIPAGLWFLLSSLGVARADVAIGVSAGLVVEPTVPVPVLVPPAPPVHLPPAPVYSPASAVVQAGPVVAGGEWAFTSQYGWVYMPYDSRYVVAYASRPYAYVYCSGFGWRWLAAPWVVGSGPYPYFAGRGPFTYDWYRSLHRAGHPMALHYAELGRRPWGGPRTVPGPAARGIHPATPHTPVRPMASPRAMSRPATVAWRHSPGSFGRSGSGPALRHR